MEEMIRPSADLRNHYADISRTCKETRQPVVLNLQDYRQMQAELELLRALADSEADVAAGRVAPMEDTFRDLRARLAERNDG